MASIEDINNVYTITIEDSLTALEQRPLEIEVMQNFDQSRLQTGDLESVLDSANEPYRIDFGADIFQ